jgi:uncharacterized membrane protein
MIDARRSWDLHPTVEDLRPSDRPPPTLEWLLFRRVVFYGASLVVMSLLALLRDLWIAQLVLTPMLLVVPGLLLLNALRVPGPSVAAFPLYVPAASLMVLMGTGLAVNFIGPLLGVDVPLRPAPLLIGSQLVCLCLLLAGLTAPLSTAIPRPALPSARWLALSMVLPLLAAAGALRLDHGAGGAVAVLALAVCLIVLLVAALIADRLDVTRLSLLLFAASLAMMWAFSLRSDLVYGYDIAAEIYTVHQTVTAGVWHAGPHPDAYGAMLSLTILPAQLHAVTGIPDLLVLKLVYPAIFAMFPVGIFNIATRFLPHRWAFVAATFVLVQGGTAQQLPALARQEIAFLLFLALMGAILELGIPTFPRVALLCAFGIGVVVSHYSTAYFMFVMLGGALVVQVALWLLRRTAPVRWTVAAALMVSALSAGAWYGPITHSASNVGQLRAVVSSDGLQLLPHGKGKNLIAAYLAGGDGATLPVTDYDRQVRELYANKKFIHPPADAGDPRYALRDSAAPKRAPVAPPVSALLDLVVLAAAQLANLLGVVAALLMVLQRRSPGLTRQVGLLALPALGSLVLFRLSGTLSTTYNQGRAQLQALTVVSVALFWLLHRLAPGLSRMAAQLRPARFDRFVWVLASVTVLTISLRGSGLANVALGGGTAANLTAEGEDFERFYIRSSEVASAQWLAGQVNGRPGFIYADRYGQIRLFSQLGTSRTGMFADLDPRVMNQSAWIYASQVNVIDGRARSTASNSLATYAFPEAFVSDHYDLVYTNGTSKVFHR